jgi:transcription elongation factor Elf1
MGRRRRKTAPRRPMRTIPSVFNCPKCGRATVRVELDRNSRQAEVHCSNCDVQALISITPLTEPVDVYGEFVDICARNQTTTSKPENSQLPQKQ